MTIPQILSALLDVTRSPAVATPRRKPQQDTHAPLVSWNGKARTRREDELARFRQESMATTESLG